MNCIFLGVQLVIDRARDRADHFGRLRDIVRNAKKSQTSRDNGDLHQSVALCMNDLLPIATSGYWDLILDPSRAAAEFRDWCEDIEWADSLSHKESPNPFRSLASGEFMIATVAFRILKGSISADVLGRECDLPEHAFWTRNTFGLLFRCIPAMHFTDVESDAVYVVPGTSDHGVPETALQEPGFAYLRPLQG